ncbi:hypothetical protein CLV51_104324 [Chitinophaga niastensis]|uniref:Uncharacterized protein n=1 Tax=Chitinophaga niastensis TaxID=536980 RepID=A0A2P8HHB5_CHINA|nr:hypothetical protein [Chitinophaga niastensis]PSL45618.1 hypothetical protein CLV51_104324 [Chitinophaga niastensis]
MSDEEKKKPLTYLEKLRQSALNQKNYGGEVNMEEARVEARDCPNCGAGRAYRHGLTACAYCGFTFMDIKLTDGVHIKKENNS